MDIQIAYAFSRLKIPEVYLNVWAVDDLIDFIDFTVSNESETSKNSKEQFTSNDEIARF